MATKIHLKRSDDLQIARNEHLEYGEPLYTNDEYLTVGNRAEDIVNDRKVVRLVLQSNADNTVFANVLNGVYTLKIVDSSGNDVEIVTIGDAASKAVTSSVIAESSDLITSGGVHSYLSTIGINSKQVSTSMDENSTNTQIPTAKAVADFVKQYVSEELSKYKCWSFDTTNQNKIYVDVTNGIKYYNNSSWGTLPVGYTQS